MQFIVLIFLHPVLFSVVFMSNLSGAVRAGAGSDSVCTWLSEHTGVGVGSLGPPCLPAAEVPRVLAQWYLAKLCSEPAPQGMFFQQVKCISLVQLNLSCTLFTGQHRML